MCPDNSRTLFCGHPIAAYLATANKGRQPEVKFCTRTSGIILFEILRKAEDNITPTENPNFHTELNNSQQLKRRCGIIDNLHYAYPTIITEAWQYHVKWVQTKAKLAGAIVKRDGCWAVGDGWFVKDENEAVDLCKDMLSINEVETIVPTRSFNTAESTILSRFGKARSDGAIPTRNNTGNPSFTNRSPSHNPKGKSKVQQTMEELADKQMQHLEAARELDRHLMEMWKKG